MLHTLVGQLTPEEDHAFQYSASIVVSLIVSPRANACIITIHPKPCIAEKTNKHIALDSAAYYTTVCDAYLSFIFYNFFNNVVCWGKSIPPFTAMVHWLYSAWLEVALVLVEYYTSFKIID